MSTPSFARETPRGSALPTLENPLFPYSYAENLSDLSPLAIRSTDLLLAQPTEIQDEVEIVLPGETRVVTLPQDREISSPFGSFKSVAEEKDGTVRITRTLTLHPRRVKVEEYSEFRQFCNDVDRARREKVIVKLQGEMKE